MSLIQSDSPNTLTSIVSLKYAYFVKIIMFFGDFYVTYTHIRTVFKIPTWVGMCFRPSKE